VLFRRSFAASVWRLVHEAAPDVAAPTPAPPEERAAPPAPAARPGPATDAALQLLALLQQEGRLIDFLEQDVASFSDADVGSAARVVHDGCRRALRAHAKLLPVRTEEEGARVTLAAGFSPDEIKLTGNVVGDAPFTGVLRHRGWRVTELVLPTAVRSYDARVLAPAEVEL
jgi:hypothetical protein